jgi:hypothetical protein
MYNSKNHTFEEVSRALRTEKAAKPKVVIAGSAICNTAAFGFISELRETANH